VIRNTDEGDGVTIWVGEMKDQSETRRKRTAGRVKSSLAISKRIRYKW